MQGVLQSLGRGVQAGHHLDGKVPKGGEGFGRRQGR